MERFSRENLIGNGMRDQATPFQRVMRIVALMCALLPAFYVCLIGMHYRFPRMDLSSDVPFYLGCFVVMALPCVCACVGAFASAQWPRLKKSAIVALLALSILFAVAAGTGIMLFPPYISATDGGESYLLLDEEVEAHFDTSALPAVIPEEAEQVVYAYRYTHSLRYGSGTAFVYAQWRLPGDEYVREKERLLRLASDAAYVCRVEGAVTFIDAGNGFACECNDSTCGVRYAFTLYPENLNARYAVEPAW